jgi:hypothetical protein
MEKVAKPLETRLTSVKVMTLKERNWRAQNKLITKKEILLKIK